MSEQPSYIVASGYLFTAIEDLNALKQKLLKAMRQHQLLGTFIIAPEGINTSFCGLPKRVDAFLQQLKKDERFKSIECQCMPTAHMPFERAKVKIRKEIVTMGVENVTALSDQDTHLDPDAWNQLLDDPEVLVIDTRNDYEVHIGHFQHAINPQTETFRDFPHYVQTELMDKKHKKIAMYCTGGIRCEKSTAYLKQLGFESVYQLKGGILNYLKQVPENTSKWDGQCFVFDDRIAL